MTDYELGLRDFAVVLQFFCDSFAVIWPSGILIRIRILRIYFKKFLQTHNAAFLNLIRYRILITQNHRELRGPFKAGRTVHTRTTPCEKWRSHLHSQSWQRTLCMVWCMIWWLASTEKSLVMHDTECPYWDQVSLNNWNTNILYLLLLQRSWSQQHQCREEGLAVRLGLPPNSVSITAQWEGMGDVGSVRYEHYCPHARP